VPGHRCTPVMPHNNHPFLVQGLHEADDIPGQLEDVVGFDRLRSGCLAVTALVRGNYMVPCRRQGRQLVPLGIPAFWEAVIQHDQRAFTLFGDMHTNAVAVDKAVVQSSHLTFSAARLPALTLRLISPSTRFCRGSAAFLGGGRFHSVIFWQTNEFLDTLSQFRHALSADVEQARIFQMLVGLHEGDRSHDSGRGGINDDLIPQIGILLD
jgi:hypothetical protein